MAGINREHSKDDRNRGIAPQDRDLIESRDLGDVNGDPGVGGLLADPLEPTATSDKDDTSVSGVPSPDPEQPEAHGDWSPNRPWRDPTEK
ncbi:MAG: hypothetical protein JWM58_1206 [Rhizobium sp.]|nr:hypothetical protein [Rhizobium sp.]